MKKRIGYIDEDEGQKNTFYNSLKDEFDVHLIDIAEGVTIESLTDEIFSSNLDMLVLDFRLDETGLVDFNAESLIDQIKRRNTFYPLIVLTSHQVDALNHVSDANLVNDKQQMLNNDLDVLKQKLNKIAESYQRQKESSEEGLRRLEEILRKGELTPEQEDQYVELNSYLEKTMHGDSRISRTFFSQSTNRKLDELISKAEEVLKQISK